MKYKIGKKWEVTREDRLLLLAARTEINEEIISEIVSILKQGIDWDYLIKRSKDHKLTSLLYWNLNSTCPDSVPPNIMDKLKAFFEENAHKNLSLTGELIKILKCLKSNHICAINFKGPSLALLAYNNLALREFIDIDILINRSDTVKVSHLMNQTGYVLESYPEKIDESLYFKTQTEHKFIHEKSGAVIEIHTRLQGHFFNFPMNPHFMYKNEKLDTLKINNYELKTFSTENLVILLSVHCARHNWSSISWICDVSELIQHHEINWSEVTRNAGKLGVMRILLITLSLVDDLLRTPFPREIRDLFEDDDVRDITLQIRNRLFRGNCHSLTVFERISLDLRKRESLKMGLRDVLSSTLKPTYEDFRKLPLPSRLFFLYYIIRPVLLLKRL